MERRSSRKESIWTDHSRFKSGVLHCIMVFLCVDIGATNTVLGVGEEDFRKVEKVDTGDFLEDIVSCVETLLSMGREDVDEVAVAAAGPVDMDEGLFCPPNIDMEKVQIREPLEKFAEVDILNDCAAAVFGEYHCGETAEDLLYITISSGIGAAFITNGKLVEGWNGNFGEVGHMTVGEERECGCGGRGHWEAYCSGENLVEMAEELHDFEVDYPREVFEEGGEKVLEEFRERNATALADLINLCNPEKIVFGGAVALNHFREVEKSVEMIHDEEIVNERPEVSRCGLGEHSVLHGLRSHCNST